MNLPDIRDYTGPLLSRNDLVSCVRVSSHWHQSFIPFLYARVNTWDDQKWSTSAIQTRLHHIRNLSIHDGMIPQQRNLILENCIQLTDLSISLTNMNLDEIQSLLRTLCGQNLRLSKIKLRYYPIESEAPKLWPTIEIARPRVTELRLERYTLDRRSIVHLLDLAVELQVLQLTGCPLSTPASPWTKWPVFSKLRELEIQATREGLSWERQLRFLFARCPNLESLIWDMDCLDHGVVDLAELMESFASLLKKSTWPKLSSLSLFQTSPSTTTPMITDAQLAKLLLSSPPLKRLSLPRSSFGPLAWEVLRRHFETLESLNLAQSPCFKSWMCQEVLVSCPQLKELAALRLEAFDLVTGYGAEAKRQEVRNASYVTNVSSRPQERPLPWVCWRLESLSVTLVRMPSNLANSQVVQQLVRMRELKVLMLNADDSGKTKSTGIEPETLPGMNPRWDYSDMNCATFSKIQMRSHPYGRRVLEIWPRLESCLLR